MGTNYKGIAFPFQKGPKGLPAEATNETLIKQSLVRLIMTQKGERYMRPTLGCNALDYVFEPIDEALTAYVQESVAQVVAEYEPRVSLQSVTVTRDEGMDTSVTVTVYYVLVATGQTDRVRVTVG